MSGKTKSMAVIAKLQDYAKKLNDALMDMSNGMSITKACEKNQIDERSLRHLIYKPLQEIRSSPELSMEMLLTPAETLYCDVLELSKEKLQAVPADLDETIEKAITEAKLTPGQQHVIKQVYWEDKTQAEIANDMHVTHARVNQLYTAAIRRLRKRPIMLLLRYGASYEAKCRAIRDQWKEESNKEIEENLKALKQSLESAKQERNLERLKQVYLETQAAILAAQESPENNNPICTLAFPEDMIQKLADCNIYVIRDLYFATNAVTEKLTPREKELLQNYLDKKGITLLTEAQAQQIQTIMPTVYMPQRIDQTAMSNRTIRALMRNGYTYIHELRNLSIEDLYAMRGMGDACVNEVRKELEIHS